MPANNTIRDLIDGLVACDEQPSEECLMELRKTLELKVTQMKRNGRGSQSVFFAGIVTMALGYAIVAIAAAGRQSVAWLLMTGFSALIAGAIVVVIGAIGLFLFRGFGYVWARHDLQDAAMLELSLQVQRLSQRIDASEKANTPLS
ncbi:MAG: hypothetical protein JWN70_4617 [Planctomycetaceae bacterium]|nr:hypothetical protein [Planctomycetaceae bacterium]